MFSLKDTIRKTIVAVSLAALTTSFFTGCSKETPVTSSDLYPPSSITDEIGTTDDINPGNNDETHDSDTFSIKYKYWYDNPDVQKAQEEALAQNDPGGDNPDGSTFLDLAGLPLYTDSSGNQYIISGRTIVYVNDGKISPMSTYFLRDNNGNKIYTLVNMTKDEFTKYRKEFDVALDKAGVQQATTYDERVSSNLSTTEAVQGRELYINNIKVYDVDNNAVTVANSVNLSTIFSVVNNGMCAATDTGHKITLFTAAGLIEINATELSSSGYELSYSTNIDNVTTAPDEISFTDADAIVSLAALEDYLGFDVEYYDGFINIVTDNKDIVSVDNTVSLAEIKEHTDPDMNPDTSDLDPQNPMPISKPAPEHEDTKPTEETQAKPENNKTPDGKYDLTASDIINSDGTYSTDLTKDTVDPVTGEIVTADDIKTWGLDELKSNPSKIPYSQITVENAAEAFPYLGWYGSIPDYVEVEPGMSNSEITEAIAANLFGSTPHYGSFITKDNCPRFFFKSEAEYNDYLAEEQAKFDAIEKSDQEMREHREKVLKGEEKIGDGFSQDALDDFFSGR